MVVFLLGVGGALDPPVFARVVSSSRFLGTVAGSLLRQKRAHAAHSVNNHHSSLIWAKKERQVALWQGGCLGEVLCGRLCVLFTRVQGRRREGDRGISIGAWAM